jgi:hypothetical protein
VAAGTALFAGTTTGRPHDQRERASDRHSLHRESGWVVDPKLTP